MISSERYCPHASLSLLSTWVFIAVVAVSTRLTFITNLWIMAGHFLGVGCCCQADGTFLIFKMYNVFKGVLRLRIRESVIREERKPIRRE